MYSKTIPNLTKIQSRNLFTAKIIKDDKCHGLKEMGEDSKNRRSVSQQDINKAFTGAATNQGEDKIEDGQAQ